MLIHSESYSAVVVMISNKSVPMCNRFTLDKSVAVK